MKLYLRIDYFQISFQLQFFFFFLFFTLYNKFVYIKVRFKNLHFKFAFNNTVEQTDLLINSQKKIKNKKQVGKLFKKEIAIDIYIYI